MPLPASLLRGHSEKPKTMVGLFGQIAVYGRGQNGYLRRYYARRWVHVALPRPHHEANVQDIRNIGIIAHVDAVRCPYSLLHM